jgi:hypothetical protein
MCHHTQPFFFEIGFCCVVYAGLELEAPLSLNLLSLSAGISGMHHHAWKMIIFKKVSYTLVLNSKLG